MQNTPTGATAAGQGQAQTPATAQFLIYNDLVSGAPARINWPTLEGLPAETRIQIMKRSVNAETILELSPHYELARTSRDTVRYRQLTRFVDRHFEPDSHDSEDITSGVNIFWEHSPVFMDDTHARARNQWFVRQQNPHTDAVVPVADARTNLESLTSASSKLRDEAIEAGRAIHLPVMLTNSGVPSMDQLPELFQAVVAGSRELIFRHSWSARNQRAFGPFLGAMSDLRHIIFPSLEIEMAVAEAEWDAGKLAAGLWLDRDKRAHKIILDFLRELMPDGFTLGPVTRNGLQQGQAVRRATMYREVVVVNSTQTVDHNGVEGNTFVQRLAVVLGQDVTNTDETHQPFIARVNWIFDGDVGSRTIAETRAVVAQHEDYRAANPSAYLDGVVAPGTDDLQSQTRWTMSAQETWDTWIRRRELAGHGLRPMREIVESGQYSIPSIVSLR